MIVDLDVRTLEPGELVERLADPHRCAGAFRQLLVLGPSARSAAIDGLGHDNARVRARCCGVLDHIGDAEAFEALLAAVDDPEPEVRVQAIHALACDRCKSGECRPDASTVLPRAIAALAGDDDPHVRAFAVELVGAWAHSHPEAVGALEVAAASDASPAVRKKARWYAPDGAVFVRTRPKPARIPRAR